MNVDVPSPVLRTSYKDEVTEKVKRRKEKEPKVIPITINTLEGLLSYFLSNPDEKSVKTSKIVILGIDSIDLALKFQDFENFPNELKDLELIFTRSSFKDPHDMNIILKAILEKKPELETFKLTIHDINATLKMINFAVLRNLKKLKVLKLNLGMNSLEPETQDKILDSCDGHPELTSLALALNECDLKDDFLLKMNAKLFEEFRIQSKLKRFKLNLAKNCFDFGMDFNLPLVRKLFVSFENLEILKVNMGYNESVNQALNGMGQILAGTLIKMLTLRIFKLNLYYCNLKHENVEILCEGLAKLNEKLEIEVDLRQPIEYEIEIRTIKAIEGMISLYRAVTNPRKFHVFY
jgi:hypothetical protein